MTRLLFLILLLLAGCTAPAPDPSLSGAPRAHLLYVANHGMHTGIIVSSNDVPAGAWPARDDFPDARFLELGWGDREYYMRDDPGILLGARALLWPTASAVHAIGVRESIGQAFPGSEIVPLRLTEDGLRRLVAFVAATHSRDAAGRAIVLGPGQRPNSRFYASDRRFHLFETCNTWVAHALLQAGLPVNPRRAVFASDLMRQVREIAVEAQPL